MKTVCPNEDDLLAFHLGKLAANRVDAVADHLEECKACEAAVAHLENTGDPLLSVLRKLAPTESVLPRSEIGSDREGRTTKAPSVPGYEILARLGAGGMGVVYRAWQQRLKRQVALKRLPADTERALGRSRAEAEALARLRHPNIVQVYEVFEHADATYLVLELVEGGTLRSKLGKPQRPAETAGLVGALAAGVHHAHGLGIVHRDLKPENILLQPSEDNSPYGVPKISDFGVAKQIAAVGGETRDGDVIGTPSYMAPEQASGDLQKIGPASDIYGLGVILYEMLTGRVPIQGPTTLDTLTQVRTTDPVPPRRLQPRLPRDLETVCLKCLEKEPARRYGSAGELAADLRRFLAEEPVRARPPSSVYRFSKFALRNKTLLAGLFGIASALVVGLTFTLFFAFAEARQHRAAAANAAEAIREAYRGRIAAATAALQSHDVSEAAHHLALAPESLRDWEWHHLHSRLDESSAVFRRAANERLFLEPGPHGIGLFSLTDSGSRFQDEDGREIQRASVKSIYAFHAGNNLRDMRLLALSNRAAAGTVVLDGEGTTLLCLPDNLDAVSSPDARKVAVRFGTPGANEERFSVIDIYTRKQLEFVGHSGLVHQLAFSPDSKQIASVSEDATARIWDAATARTIAVLRGHAVKTLSIHFRSDGARVVTASADGTVRQWDPRTGQEIEPPYDRHTGEVYAATYSPDGNLIASAGADRTIRLWQASGRRDVLVRHGSNLPVRRLIFSPDGSRLASSEEDDTVRIWETDPGVALPSLTGHTSYVYPIAYSPDGRTLASGSWDSTVRLWDARTGECRKVLLHPSRVMDLAFTSDGAHLVTGCGKDNLLRIWDVTTGKLWKELAGADSSLDGVAVRPGSFDVAALEKDGNICITDVASGKRLNSIIPKTPAKIAYSPDGNLLAFGNADGSVGLWDVENSRRSTDLRGHVLTVTALAFGPGGRQLASASLDHTIRIWDIRTRQCRCVLAGHPDDIFGLAFHPAGRRLASAGRDGVIWLWDVATGTEVARLRGHKNYIWSLAFSPDGSTLATGSGDGTLRLWDTEPVADRYRALRESKVREAKERQ